MIMSRAEDKALKAYPDERFIDEDYAEMCRSFYIEGYKQAEEDFTHIEDADDSKQAAVHYMEDCQEVDDFVRRGIDEIAERYFCKGAEWCKKDLIEKAVIWLKTHTYTFETPEMVTLFIELFKEAMTK